MLTGRLRPAERQAVVDAFQQGESSLLICTYGAGGLGFNKHHKRAALNKRLPHPDSIVFVGDFQGVPQLADFLLARLRNRTLYVFVS